MGGGRSASRHFQEVEHQRHELLQLLVEQHELARDLASRLVVAVALADIEDAAQHLEQRQVWHGLSVGGAVRLVDTDAARAAALYELVAEPALASASVRDHSHNLAVPGHGCLERALEPGHLVCPTHEARETPRTRRVEPRAERTHVLQLVHTHLLAHALERELFEVA